MKKKALFNHNIYNSVTYNIVNITDPKKYHIEEKNLFYNICPCRPRSLIIGGRWLDQRNSMGISHPSPSRSATTFLARFLFSNFTGEQWFFGFCILNMDFFQFWTVFLHTRVRDFLFLFLVCVCGRWGGGKGSAVRLPQIFF